MAEIFRDQIFENFEVKSNFTFTSSDFVVNDIFNDLSSNYYDLSDAFTDLSGRVQVLEDGGGGSADLTDLSNTVDDLSTNYIVTSNQFVELSGQFQDLSTDFIDLSTNFIDLSTDFIDLSTDFTDLSTNYIVTSNQFVELSGQFQDLSTNYIVTSNQFVELSGQFVELSGQFQDLSTDFTDLSTNYIVTSNQFVELSGEFQDLSTNYIVTSNQFVELSGQFQDLSTNYIVTSNQFVELSGQFQDLSTDFTDLSTNYIITSNQFVELSGQFQDLSTDFIDLSNAVTAIEETGVGDLVDLTNEFDDLSEYVYNSLGSNSNYTINIGTNQVEVADSNIFIGHGGVGTGVSTGTSNLFIGLNIGSNSTNYSNQSNIMIIGKHSSGSSVPILANLSTKKLGIGITETDFNPAYELTISGDVSASIFYGTEFRAESDERLKTNIRPIEQSDTIISQLEPVYFNWKNESRGNNLEMGFIAQQVEEVFPSLVGTSSNGIKTLAYQKMVAILTAELKQQHKRISYLENKISALELN
jgi:hypothetical protein